MSESAGFWEGAAGISTYAGGGGGGGGGGGPPAAGAEGAVDVAAVEVDVRFKLLLSRMFP